MKEIFLKLTISVFSKMLKIILVSLTTSDAGRQVVRYVQDFVSCRKKHLPEAGVRQLLT